VQPGDTLATLAARYQTSAASLSAANCLFSSNLPAGSIIYVPPFPTQTRVPCGPPSSWVRYTVRSGDTLTSLSQAFGVSISQLQFANCMASNQFGLTVGQTIYVPNVPTRTPRATATKTLTPVVIIFPTITGSVTATQAVPTVPTIPTATNTFMPTDTQTASPTASLIPTVPSPTTPPTTPPTATPTVTAFPSATNTPPTPSQ
jgi:LysM repeat protein